MKRKSRFVMIKAIDSLPNEDDYDNTYKLTTR